MLTNGIINVYKEEGFTSHDVIAKLRGILGFRHVGHTGTLDPMASGVLPVCIGAATKVCDIMNEKSKAYEAVILFGTATDTEDITGNVTKTLPVFAKEEDLKNAFGRFIGDIQQTPPLYSAIKINGQRSYDLVRSGKAKDLEKRNVRIDRIELIDSVTDDDGNLKEAKILVECGKGTYIRSLCRDLGEALGTCATMKELVRIKTDMFTIDKAYKLSEIQELKDTGRIEEIILPIDKYFEAYPVLTTLPEFDYLVRNGNPLKKRETVFDRPIVELYRAYDSEGKFYGVYYFDKKHGRFSPFKMFLEVYN